MIKLARIMLPPLFFIILMISCTIIDKENSNVSEMKDMTLPVVYITNLSSDINGEVKVPVKIEIFESHENFNSKDSKAVSYHAGMIRVRGQSSRMFPKKSLLLETKKKSDISKSNNIKFLGLPSENDWVLYAPYTDKTLLRNYIAYTLARQLGIYAPRVKFFEMYCNMPEDDSDKVEYQGIYMLTEKIKRDRNRVNINKLNITDTALSDITGGYIFRIDKWKEREFVYTSNNVMVLIEYPKPDNLNYHQKEYLNTYFYSFEEALAKFDKTSPHNDYHDYFDLQAAADFFLLNELYKNIDGYRISTYMYKDRNDKIKMGPIWDFDLALGNANYHEGEKTYGWQLDYMLRDDFNDGYKPPYWWKTIRNDPAFINIMKKRWRYMRKNAVTTKNINKIIDSALFDLGDSIERNFKRWEILGNHVWPNPVTFPTHKEEVEYLKKWLTDRIEWMDSQILE